MAFRLLSRHSKYIRPNFGVPIGIQKSSVRWFSQDVPTEADVVVIGGGSIGMSCAYHLQKMGMKAVLLERSQYTSGTTWHSAGMLWGLRTSDSEVLLSAYTRKMCKQLEEETGEVSWSENGGLFIANNKERLEEYKRLSELGSYFGVESQVVGPSEIKEIHPLLNVDDVYGGVYSPTDGTIDPTGIVNAYAKAAKKLGAQLFEGTGVSAIETEAYKTVGGTDTRKITGVVTSNGQRIKTTHVVNAAGCWANEIANLAGVKIPLRAMKHAMVVTESMEGMHKGLPNVRDHDLSVYLKTQGDSMAIGGYEPNPEFWNNVDPGFSFGLFDLDWDTFAMNMDGHLQRCPSIESAGIKSTVCGPESFTPDHKALMGPQRGLNGFFNACGFNSMGMLLGGGCGQQLAYWITEGTPRLDMFGMDCNRFHEDTIRNNDWVQTRTHESYAKTYAIVYPHDEALAGRNLRTSPLHNQLLKRGCIHQMRHGFERPGWFVPETGEQAVKPYDFFGAYSEEDTAWRINKDGGNLLEGSSYLDVDSIPKHEEHKYHDYIDGELTFDWPASFPLVAKECEAARTGAVLFDQSYFGKFRLSGPDADSAVQWLCGADMEGIALGRVVYTPLCNHRGGVEADLTVTRLGETTIAGMNQGEYYFAAGGHTASKDFLWISKVLEQGNFNAALEDVSGELSMLSIQGPHSRTLVQSLITSDHDLTDLAFSNCVQLEIAGMPALCLRLTFVGELGFELHVPAEHSEAVYLAIRQAGEEYSKKHNVPIADAGYRTIDSMSAEKGYRHWHADVSNADTPLEASIGFTVLSKLKREDGKADFLGRQALEAQRAGGVKRKLVCLTLDENVPLHGFETVYRDGECVGLIKSTAYGHSIGKTIVYAYVHSSDPAEQQAGSKFKVTNKWLNAGSWHVGDKGKRLPATVHVKAPFDPKNDRVKGNYATAE